MSQLLQFYKSFHQARVPDTKAAPTFEDLTIDDNLSENQRVIKYVKSTIGLQRLVHVKMLADVSADIGFENTVQAIIPLLDPLSKDVEPVVKQHLVEQVKHLSKFCCTNGGEKGYQLILDTFLPIIARLLEDDKPEVRQSASMTLVDIAPLVKMDDIGQYVLTIILRLAHEDDREEMRMTACQLLNLLAECLGYDLCKQFVIPEVVSLAEDPVFRVRKSTALNFHLICKVGGEHELLERLMPAFVRLSKDDMYRVRRACAESLSEIAKNVSEMIRLGVLVEIFLRLSQDPSRLVKQSTLQQSGMFIATLPGRAVNEAILSHFCSMATGPAGDINVDAELKHICAYSFPAVLLVIGKERWREVREIYHLLTQSRSPNIKQTLAYSMHEVAKILDDEMLVEEELVPVFEEMIQDVEVVQMGVIKNLASFLGKLPEPCRVSYLPLLHDILHSTNPFNWRLRQYLAKQIPDLILLPPPDDLFRTLFRLVMILLQDPVASVRQESFPGVSALILALHTFACSCDAPPNPQLHQQNLEELCSAINTFYLDEKFQLRLLWVELSHHLLRDLPRELFEKYFLAGMLLLARDRVSNVRVALAKALAGWAPLDSPPWKAVQEDAEEIRGGQGKGDNDNAGIVTSSKGTGGGGGSSGTAGGEMDEGTDPYSSSSTSALGESGKSGSSTAAIYDSRRHSSTSSLSSISTKGEVEISTTEDGAPSSSSPSGNSPDSSIGLQSSSPPAGLQRSRPSPWTWLLKRPDVVKECVQRLAIDTQDVYFHMIKLQPYFPDINFAGTAIRGSLRSMKGAVVASPQLMRGLETADSILSASSLDPARREDGAAGAGGERRSSSAGEMSSSSSSSKNSSSPRSDLSLPPVSPDIQEAHDHMLAPGSGAPNLDTDIGGHHPSVLDDMENDLVADLDLLDVQDIGVVLPGDTDRPRTRSRSGSGGSAGGSAKGAPISILGRNSFLEEYDPEEIAEAELEKEMKRRGSESGSGSGSGGGGVRSREGSRDGSSEDAALLLASLSGINLTPPEEKESSGDGKDESISGNKASDGSGISGENRNNKDVVASAGKTNSRSILDEMDEWIAGKVDLSGAPTTASSPSPSAASAQQQRGKDEEGGGVRNAEPTEGASRKSAKEIMSTGGRNVESIDQFLDHVTDK